jgi:hypothetical protein
MAKHLGSKITVSANRADGTCGPKTSMKTVAKVAGGRVDSGSGGQPKSRK